jgi:hypothetical protein
VALLWIAVSDSRIGRVRIIKNHVYNGAVDGSFNHAVMVSTRQTNAGDSAASNIGFRCAGGAPSAPKTVKQNGDDDVKRPKPRKRKEAGNNQARESKKKAAEADDSLIVEL